MKFKSNYVIASCIIIAALGITTYAYQNNIFFNVGQKVKDITKNNDTGIVAVVGDKKITKKEFDTFKTLYSASDNIPSDTELIEKMIKNEVIYEQAIKDNINVSEEELDKALQEQKDIIAKDRDANMSYKNYVSGLNITEEEYWEKAKEGIKKALIRGKYKNKLKESFKEENPDIKDNEFQAKFNKYYNDIVTTLKNGMKIENYIK
ncbi:MAG: SurA N-terminal domain-containing protein [Clostridia bacterium]|nr:SurA N-terminal domain-containing protein [Clostridia bacterium]